MPQLPTFLTTKRFHFRLNLKRFAFESALRYVSSVGNNIVGFIENNVYMEVLYANVVLCLINLKLILKNESTSILYF